MASFSLSLLSFPPPFLTLSTPGFQVAAYPLRRFPDRATINPTFGKAEGPPKLSALT